MNHPTVRPVGKLAIANGGWPNIEKQRHVRNWPLSRTRKDENMYRSELRIHIRIAPGQGGNAKSITVPIRKYIPEQLETWENRSDGTIWIRYTKNRHEIFQRTRTPRCLYANLVMPAMRLRPWQIPAVPSIRTHSSQSWVRLTHPKRKIGNPDTRQICKRTGDQPNRWSKSTHGRRDRKPTNPHETQRERWNLMGMWQLWRSVQNRERDNNPHWQNARRSQNTETHLPILPGNLL